MNEPLSLRKPRKAATPLRVVTRAETSGSRSRGQHAGTKPRSQQTMTILHPARELMICLGWLRLLQRICSPGVLIASKEFGHEQ
jgi:hypothetical protein